MIYSAIIEVRMTSSRLPGKPLLEACKKSMLEHLILRLQKSKLLNKIVVATTTNKSDDPIVNLAKKIGVNYFCGDEDDVMKRVIGAASSVNTDVVVEITGDCPLIDPSLVDQAISIHKNNNADYVSNAHVRSYPDGMDIQVIELKALKKSYEMTNDPLHLEHVSLHIRENPEIFSHINIVAPPELFWPELGITLDEERDYILIKEIFEHFHKEANTFFSCYDIINFLSKNKELTKINQDVMRKGDS